MPVWESYLNPSSLESFETLVWFQDVRGFSTPPPPDLAGATGLSSHIKAISSGDVLGGGSGGQ